MNHASNIEPYPGLRPFRRDEVNVFYGRDDHTSEMVEKLAAHHFLCITGPSGCGKSSIAKTGLINALEAGFLPGAGSDWLFVELRPGSNPLLMLFAAIADSICDDSDISPRRDELIQLIKNNTEQRSHDLNSAMELIREICDRPIFILVDQFEELFRFAQDNVNSAKTFIDILLRTVAANKNIYIAITIRTDKLEYCSDYSGLTQAINSSQFLTPTLDRFQTQEAIDGPINIVNGIIEPELSIWLLNSVEELPDKLPLLQHALKYIYTRKSSEPDKGLPEQSGGNEKAEDEKSLPDIVIGLVDFAEAFGFDATKIEELSTDRSILTSSLSIALDRIYLSLRKDLRHGARSLFCALTDTESLSRDIRRPCSVRQLANSIALSVEDTWQIVRAFSDGNMAYLYVAENAEDPDGSIVDVTHECILRLWENLRDEWLPDELRNADDIRFLATTAKIFEEAKISNPVSSGIFGSGALSGYLLERYAKWFKSIKPTHQWAERYLNNVNWPDRDVQKDTQAIANANTANNVANLSNEAKFTRLIKFLSFSKRRRATLIIAPTLSAVLIYLGFLAWAWQNTIAAQNREETAKLNLAKALNSVVIDIENQDPFGKSLYIPVDPQQNNCGPADKFCMQLKNNIALSPKLGELERLSKAPLCENLGAINAISRLGGNTPPFCRRYPPTLAGNVGTPKLISGSDKSLAAVGSSLLSQSTETKQQARSIFFALANKYPEKPGFFRALSTGYLIDDKIPDGRRFSEANACFARAIENYCRPDFNARSLYKGLNSYIDQTLSNISAGGEKFTLDGEAIALNMMLSSQLLDDETLRADVSTEELTPERISRLWRGFDAASDAARGLNSRYECGKVEPPNPQCTIVPKLYKRAADALALVVNFGKSDPVSSKLKTEISYGIGVGALHWGQDPNFRMIALSVIDQPDLLRESEKAYQNRKSARYPTGLSMLYCFEKRYEKAKTTAEAIRDDRPKYTSVRDKVQTCADSPDIESHFNADNPSE